MALEVDIYTRNLDMTDRIQDYVTKKVTKLDRFLNGIEEARVDLAYEKAARSMTDRQIAQITIRGKGFILRSEERADDIFAAMDTALDKMQRQIERYKGKRFRGRGDGKSAADVVEQPAADEGEAEPARTIVRRKTFRLHPMNELEAIEQMALLGHENFFIFYNVETNSVNVLYVRRDGSYGLIDALYG